MTTVQNIEYTGPKTKDALDTFCKNASFGCFIFSTTIFSDVVITKRDKLPGSKHAATDYPNGYYHNGKLVQWSQSRVIAAQNAGQTRD